MVYNGILMETIRISVMVSIGLLFFYCRDAGLLISTSKFCKFWVSFSNNIEKVNEI